MKYQIEQIELPTLFQMKTVNSYLVKGDAVTVVDCGEKSAETWEAMVRGIAQNGLEVKDIDEIVITHAHVDHMGMARRLSDESGAKVKVSDLVKPWALDLDALWDNRTEVMTTTFTELLSKEEKDTMFSFLDSFFGKISSFWDALAPDQIEVFDHQGTLTLGGAEFQSIHAPGHCHNQTCFYQKETRDLITADMLLRITPTCVVDADPQDRSKRIKGMPLLLESFQKFREMDIGSMYPGHYVITETNKELIDRQLGRIQLRKNQVYELIKSGTNKYTDIFQALYANSMNFPGMVMTIGYLDLLEDEGKISKVNSNEGSLFELK